MSFIPGAGFKKPLNQIQNPVYPDIRKGPPRFKWSRKYWQVDEGRTMLENTQQIPHNLIDTVLVQNRDYNRQFAYGKSSHRDVVNLEFRPPLQDRDDFIALTRIPRPTVVPRINPQTANDSGTNGFATQNSGISDISGFLQDRIENPSWMPSYCAPTQLVSSIDQQVLPDLQIKLPTRSVTSGFEYGFTKSNVENNVENNFQKLDAQIETGSTTNIHLDGYNAMQNLELGEKRAPISASSGFATTIVPGMQDIEIQLQNKQKPISVSSGYSTDIRSTLIEPDSDIELQYNNPMVSASSNYTTFMTPMVSNVDHVLNDNRPNVSASSNFVSSIKSSIIDQTPIDFDFVSKIGSRNTNMANVEHGYRTMNNEISARTINRPTYSYTVESNVPFREENHRDGPINAQAKKEAMSTYFGNTNMGTMPKKHIEMQKVNLRNQNVAKTKVF